MPNYRRFFVAGGTYFFTLVTHHRTPILTTDVGRDCLRNSFEKVQKRFPFDVLSIALLPDHFHAIVSLPPGDDRYPIRWSRIKEEFTERWLAKGGHEQPQSASRTRQRQRGVWQKRYWEHTISCEEDLHRCVNYVHWNPCKHKLVSAVSDWPWSSFHRFVLAGDYEPDWGQTDPVPDWHAPEWGGEF